MVGGTNWFQALSVVALAAMFVGCASSMKSEVDAEVKRLCAIDGGIQIFETVDTAAESFDSWGGLTFYRPSQGENALGPEYIFKWEKHYFHEGQPALDPSEISMRRDLVQIIRKGDGRLLGRLVTYHRAGGDPAGPWMPSSYRCPEGIESSEAELLRQVFVRKQK